MKENIGKDRMREMEEERICLLFKTSLSFENFIYIYDPLWLRCYVNKNPLIMNWI